MHLHFLIVASSAGGLPRDRRHGGVGSCCSSAIGVTCRTAACCRWQRGQPRHARREWQHGHARHTSPGLPQLAQPQRQPAKPGGRPQAGWWGRPPPQHEPDDGAQQPARPLAAGPRRLARGPGPVPGAAGPAAGPQAVLQRAPVSRCQRGAQMCNAQSGSC